MLFYEINITNYIKLDIWKSFTKKKNW